MKTVNYLFLLLMLPLLSFGQGIVSQRVQKAVNTASQSIPAYSIVDFSNQSFKDVGIDSDVLTEGFLLDLNHRNIEELYQSHPEIVELSFPLPELGETSVTLITNKVLTDDFILRNSDNQVLNYESGLYYHGIVTGQPNTLVAISVFKDEIHGLISTDNGNFVIGKLDELNNQTHIVYNDRDHKQPSELDCGTPDDGYVYTQDELSYTSSKSAGDCIRVHIEIDDDIVSNKGGATGATNYMTGLMNESITLYANDNITMLVSEIYAWTSAAPYSGSSSSAMLNSYQSNTGSFNGDLSHLMSYQASGGIAAGFAGICASNVDNSKCFSSIGSSYSLVPTYSFTVMVVTHEMGHLIGSRHTHACVWNGNGTAIDGCAGYIEGNCSVPGSPSSGGTIMSYCHITTGIDFTQGFGPQPGNVVRNTVLNATCLSPCGGGGPTCFDGVQNGDETGVDCGGSSCPTCPTPCTDNEVTVTIVLDDYPEETSWQVTNAGGSVVASGGTYGSMPDRSTFSETLCLADGCYDFTINDTYGDGICCAYGNGNYTVTDASGTLASGSSFTSSETTNFCLGGGPAPTCDDGVQNGDEAGVDCGGSNCPACPTCDDGIQNGDETGVDCGGSSCPSCPTGGTDELLGSYFETGWDNWTDGGSDCARYKGTRSYEGTYSIRIRDNTGTASAMTSPALNLSGYNQVDLTFFFYAYSMENNEDFWVRYYDGSSWQTVATYASGSSFNNNGFYSATVTLNTSQVNFASNAQFRLQCDASGNADHIYIDQVTVTATSSAFIVPGPIVSNVAPLDRPTTPSAFESSELSQSVELMDRQIQMFPNPATDMLNIRTTAEMQSVRIMSATGQLIRSEQLGSEQTAINIADLKPGMYYLLIEINGELKPQRFVKQ